MLLDDLIQVERVAEVVVDGELKDGSGGFGFGAAEQVCGGGEPSVEAVVDVDVDAVAGHLVIFLASRPAEARVRSVAVPMRV